MPRFSAHTTKSYEDEKGKQTRSGSVFYIFVEKSFDLFCGKLPAQGGKHVGMGDALKEFRKISEDKISTPHTVQKKVRKKRFGFEL